MQQQPLITIVRQRLEARLRRLWNTIRNLRFRQVMGLVMILKNFNILILPLSLLLFGYLFLSDLARNPVIQASRQTIESQTEAVRSDIQKLDDSLDDIRDDFRTLAAILKPVVDIVKAVAGVINDIIGALKLDELFDIPPIDLSNIPGIPDFSLTFGFLADIRAAIQDSLEALGDAYREIEMTFAKWWRYLQIFAAVTALWLALSFFSGLYANITRGLEMMRSRPPAVEAWKARQPFWQGRPVFETPPILVVDRASITVPTVQQQAERPGSRPTRQRMVRQPRVLLSAQAIWPDRHQALFHYELAQQADETAWASFWERLIGRGLDPQAVQLVISADIRALAEVTATYLPNAQVQRAVEAAIVPGMG